MTSKAIRATRRLAGATPQTLAKALFAPLTPNKRGKGLSHRRRTVLVGFVSVFAFAACSSSTEPASPPEPPPNPVGTYSLVTIDAVPLPVQVAVEGVELVIESSIFNVRSAGAYSVNITATSLTTGNRATIGDSGRWTQTGSTLTLLGEDCDDLAFIEGRTLRIAHDCTFGWELVYQR